MDPKQRVRLMIDLQCGSCGAIIHCGDALPAAAGGPDSEGAPRFCPCCGAVYERFCLRCRKRVDMFFEEWWPEETECVRTYTSAKHCPGCNAGLDGALKDEDSKTYDH